MTMKPEWLVICMLHERTLDGDSVEDDLSPVGQGESLVVVAYVSDLL